MNDFPREMYHNLINNFKAIYLCNSLIARVGVIKQIHPKCRSLQLLPQLFVYTTQSGIIRSLKFGLRNSGKASLIYNTH